MKTRSHRKNESGQITLDFLFGCILIIGVSAILGAITFALTLTETLQYVSFSAARNYFAGDLNVKDQTDAATAKANKLLKQLPFLSGALTTGWITIKRKSADNFSTNGYEATLGTEPDPAGYRRDQFTGYQISFTLPILNISGNIPLLGTVMRPPDGGDSFNGTVSSFLMREPSTDECMKYNQQIYNLIQQKAFSQAPTGSFKAINDNGC